MRRKLAFSAVRRVLVIPGDALEWLRGAIRGAFYAGTWLFPPFRQKKCGWVLLQSDKRRDQNEKPAVTPPEPA